MAQRLQKRDGTFVDEAKQSTESIEGFRFIVLGIGRDEALINDACDTILQSKDRFDTKQGTCELREACVSGRHVSVVKLHINWLENMKTYFSFSNGVKYMKSEMEFCYSLVFPGPHAFLLVLGDVSNSGKEHYILRALSEVFGQEALDYCKVLFMHGHVGSNIARNRCVRKCGRRFHILKENEDNVLELFNDTSTGTMIRRKENFFTKDHELLKKTEKYLRKDFKAKFEERESRLRGDLAEMKTAEENLRTKITEMEKQNAQNLQELRKEVDAYRAREDQLSEELRDCRSRENQLNQQIDALKKRKYELKEELYFLRHIKRQVNVELTPSSERESQRKSKYEELGGKKLEKNPRESKDRTLEEFPLTKTLLEDKRLQEQKEVQAPAAQEEHDRARTVDRREVELDEGNRKLQTVTGSQHGHHISTAVTSPSESTVSKVQPPSERECEMERKANKGEGVKLARRNSIQNPPNLPKDKDDPQGETGFEGLRLVRENRSKSNLQMSVL